MPDNYAIRLQNVSKIYKLHGSQRDQLIYILGLQRLGIKPRSEGKEFIALDNINLEVPRGHRIGIVGRNGAGKTTLLKLLCGNFAPTKGVVEVNGEIQALMNVGLGFHPEYTGRENIEASLQYNGLSRDECQQAMDGIIEFCELGDFLDQPFKTYSLGMQARLMFAAATAIRPDILIIDEVLGAGDAYFVAKSKRRVEDLVNSGCTMLLVSHSMQQILELCNEAIWLDKGCIRLHGDAFSVVKAYEEYLHGSTNRLTPPKSLPMQKPSSLPVKDSNNPPVNVKSSTQRGLSKSNVFLQEPNFLPHYDQNQLTTNVPATEFQFVARGGISRWESDTALKICGFSIVSERGVSNKLVSLMPASVVFHVVAEVDGHFRCRYGIVINDTMGRNVAVIYSPNDEFFLEAGRTRKVVMSLNPLQIGPGEYTLGISVLEGCPLERVNQAKRYDLLGRSFEFSIHLPDTLGALHAMLLHSAEWEFSQ